MGRDFNSFFLIVIAFISVDLKCTQET